MIIMDSILSHCLTNGLGLCPHFACSRGQIQERRARYSPRREKTRQTEKEMGRQHPGMVGLDTKRRHEESRETRGVEGAGCQDICGAPTVH